MAKLSNILNSFGGPDMLQGTQAVEYSVRTENPNASECQGT